MKFEVILATGLLVGMAFSQNETELFDGNHFDDCVKNGGTVVKNDDGTQGCTTDKPLKGFKTYSFKGNKYKCKRIKNKDGSVSVFCDCPVCGHKGAQDPLTDIPKQ